MHNLKKLFIILSVLTLSLCLHAQTDDDTLANTGIQHELKGDTLFSSDGATIFIGQKLTLGSPQRSDGLFRSIISSKAAVVPNIWGRKNRGYEHDIENYVDSKKSKEKLKKDLIAGMTLTIKKIALIGNKNKYHYYMVMLVPESGSEYYRSDILFALKIGELVLQ